MATKPGYERYNRTVDNRHRQNQITGIVIKKRVKGGQNSHSSCNAIINKNQSLTSKVPGDSIVIKILAPFELKLLARAESGASGWWKPSTINSPKRKTTWSNRADCYFRGFRQGEFANRPGGQRQL